MPRIRSSRLRAAAPLRADRRCAVWLALLAAPAQAMAASASDPTVLDFANSPTPMNAGARALGMSAFTAIADDATAMAANPGGAIQLERPEASIAGGLYTTSIHPGDGERERETRVDLDHLSVALPFFAFGHQQTVGVIWQRQFDFTRSASFTRRTVDTDFPTTDTTTVRSYTQTGAFSSLSLSYTLEIVPGLGVGLTGSVWNDDLTQDSSTTLYAHVHNDLLLPDFLSEDISDTDTATRIRIEEGYSAVLGAWWQATPALTLAAVLKPEYKLHLSQHTQSTQTDAASTPPAQASSGDSLSTLHMPMIATIAAAWRRRTRTPWRPS